MKLRILSIKKLEPSAVVSYICKLNTNFIKPMKTYFYFALLLLVTVGCSKTEESKPVLAIEEVEGNINVGIVLPLKDRDYSFHNNGDSGVYEIPTNEKNFKAKIELSETLNASPTDFIVKWISDIDGVLFEGHPNSNFESTLTTSLSKGLHTISFEVYLVNNPQLLQKDSITIANVIKLETVSRLGRIMKLNWTKYEGNDFISYLVYSINNQPIAEIADINTLQYEHSSPYSLIEEVPYQIVVKTSNPNLIYETVGSNIVAKKPGDFLSIPYYIKKMVKDPIRNKLYAICTPDDSYEVADKYGVIIINTDTFAIERHILVDRRFIDLSVSPDGQYLYLTRYRVENITKLNLNTYTYNDIITHTGGNGIWNIEAGNNDILYANIEYNSGHIQMINAVTGSSIESNWRFYFSEMRYNSSNNNLYYSEGTSSGRLFKLNSVNIPTGDYLTLPQYPPFPGGVGYPYPVVTISDDGNHIFWDEYQMNTNLNVIRLFDDIYIHACSPSNQYLSDLHKIYDFNTMNTILTYPSFGNHEFYDSDVYFTDENTIFTNKSYDPNDGTPSYSYIFRIKIN